jgi:LytS/YehU family sensor histidine kinase
MQAYLVQKSLVSEMELSLMIQQVQPHFLYNILNSIYHLCGRDPESAQEILGEFSDYLRNNLSAIASQEPVPFGRELEVVETYVYLEKVRFEDHLEVDYDIRCRDFSLPPLSVRPLVENAIKHGVNKVDHPLHILVSSIEYPDRYEVTVTDDGPGYREGVVLDDGRKHVGLSNLRKRLDIICGATLEISGQSGNGTTAVIKLKKNG